MKGNQIAIRQLTLKQEHFCQAYIETGNASEAYRRAYNTENMVANTIKAKAYKTLQLAHIRATVDVLKAEHRYKHDVTVERLTAQLNEMLEIAKAKENPAAGVQAVMAKAKLHGLIVDKAHVMTTNSETFIKLWEMLGKGELDKVAKDLALELDQQAAISHGKKPH